MPEDARQHVFSTSKDRCQRALVYDQIYDKGQALQRYLMIAQLTPLPSPPRLFNFQAQRIRDGIGDFGLLGGMEEGKTGK